MSIHFQASHGSIVVEAVIYGRGLSVHVRLLLDTGALFTMLDPRTLARVGYELTAGAPRILVATASGTERVPIVVVEQIEALGTRRADIQVLAHALPAAAGVDSLLGLNFLRGRRLTIDFRAGTLSLD